MASTNSSHFLAEPRRACNGISTFRRRALGLINKATAVCHRIHVRRSVAKAKEAVNPDLTLLEDGSSPRRLLLHLPITGSLKAREWFWKAQV
ncbi:hypothetical protein KC361_g104 [Hortaea werneckii]|nr:hypothetical protein KC361_g104 [Hortaea werneckii]